MPMIGPIEPPAHRTPSFDRVDASQDTWTSGISAYEYAAFLWMLFGHVTVQRAVRDKDGNLVMMSFVWKEEAECVHDEVLAPRPVG